MVAYLGLGSNLGDRQSELDRAILALAKLGQVEAVSAYYETEPEGGAAQPNYVNAALRLATELGAHPLLSACLNVERMHGRVRPNDGSKGPRTIDIDLLLYGSYVIDEPGLVVPHPALLVRPFVRIPLAEVAVPGLRHPISGERLDVSAQDTKVRRLRGWS